MRMQKKIIDNNLLSMVKFNSKNFTKSLSIKEAKNESKLQRIAG